MDRSLHADPWATHQLQFYTAMMIGIYVPKQGQRTVEKLQCGISSGLWLEGRIRRNEITRMPRLVSRYIPEGYMHPEVPPQPQALRVEPEFLRLAFPLRQLYLEL